jgi:hypothetical protein
MSPVAMQWHIKCFSATAVISWNNRRTLEVAFSVGNILRLYHVDQWDK